jgi:PEP-CTERM motif
MCNLVEKMRLQQLKVESFRDSCYSRITVKLRIDHFGRRRGGLARRGGAQSARALALAAAAALLAAAACAGASAAMPEIDRSWSSGFQDSPWTSDGLGRPKTPPSPLADWTAQCFVDCAPAFGARLVRWTELLSSNTADVSVNKAADPAGHPVGISGMIVTERLEPDGFGADPGALTGWTVVAERMLDGDETHSWSLSPTDGSLDSHGLPLELYRFESSSFSIDFASSAAAGANPAPEPSTWAMMLIGFAGLAGYRCLRTYRGSIHYPKRIYAR